MRILNILIIILVLSVIQNAFAKEEENDFGIVNAWYNGKEATVENVQLKIGEPAEITVSVYSKIDCNVYIKLTNPLVTNPYDIISGPTKIEETIDNYGVIKGWSNNYTWIIQPNGEWKSGTAPINVFVQFSDKGDYRTSEFTIANPYILDEQYSGPAPSSDGGAGSEGLPGFGAAGALIAVAAAVLVKRV